MPRAEAVIVMASGAFGNPFAFALWRPATRGSRGGQEAAGGASCSQVEEEEGDWAAIRC